MAHALAKPGAWQDEPWEGDVVVKVADKIFVFCSPEATSAGLKCGRDRDEADALIERYGDDVTAMRYIGRYGWNTIRIGGAIALQDLLELVDDSYDDVVSRLPARKRPETT